MNKFASIYKGMWIFMLVFCACSVLGILAILVANFTVISGIAAAIGVVFIVIIGGDYLVTHIKDIRG